MTEAAIFCYGDLEHGHTEMKILHVMKSSGLLMAGAAMASVFAATLHAAGTAKKPVQVHAIVNDVTDTRSTGSFNSRCTLALTFTGDAVADASRVLRVRVTKAEDDLGRDLVSKQDDSFEYASSGRWSSTLKAQLQLRNPSRNATVIKLVEGQVELFDPTPTNGGILVIKDILKHPADPVQNPTLKKYGIQLMYLTKESYEAKKKQIEEQQANGSSGALGEAFTSMFNGMFSGMMSSDSKNKVTLYIKDPEKRVVKVEFRNAGGKPLHRRAAWTGNEMHTMEFAAPPPPDAQLAVYLATPEATRAFPFKIENIPLP